MKPSRQTSDQARRLEARREPAAPETPPEQALHEAVRFAQATIDSLAANICVLDETGTILATNEAWRHFAEANPPLERRADTADNYLEVCDAATGPEAADATACSAGIRAVLRGERSEFVMEYPCHSPAEQRWFVMRVTRFSGEGPVRAVVAHENITVRKLAEIVTSRLAAIVASSDDAIIGKDLNSIVTSWNKGAEKIFGYTADEMVGTSIMRLIPTDRHSDEVHILGKIRLGESVEHFDTLRLTKDGRLINVSVTASPIRDAEGKVIGVSKVARDISERKRVESALQASEARLNFALQASNIGAWQLSLQDHSVHRTPIHDRIFGYYEPLAQWTYEMFLDHVVPEDRAKVETSFREARMARGNWNFDCRIRRADGEIRWISVAGGHELDSEGNAERMSGIVQDITRRKESERALQESEEWLRMVTENARLGFVIVNRERRYEYANTTYAEILGMPLPAIVGQLVADVMKETYDTVIRPHLDRAFAGERVTYEARRMTKAGDRHFALTFEPSKTDGIVKLVVAVIADITERKKLEEQFLRAQRMESIGTLAGGIAHDLNNALMPILMSVSLMEMKFTDPESQELISLIGGSAKRGADMVRQVLSFARGVEGQRIELQIKHLLRDVEKITSEAFPKNIQVRTIIPPGLWTVTGDPTQIHQVLMNLCVNARDAMPGGGKLIIAAENKVLDEQYSGLDLEAKPGPYVSLRVEDSGTGIPPELIGKIFDPFFTTKEIGKGTGLGLSTSLAIVKSHGGFVRVSSEPGKGTTFEIFLPARTESSAEAMAEIAAEMPRGEGELVLVVDDEASVRQITQQTLQAFGYRVLLASDGADAVAVYAQRRDEIAVVLTDMMMPVMDGAATIQVLRKMNPSVRIIAASGLSANAHTAQASRLNVKHFLPKPYTADALLKALKEILTEKL